MFNTQIIELPDPLPPDFVPEAGRIYANLPIEFYHDREECPGDSGSRLKKLLISPRHYLDPGKSGKGMSLGKVFHGALECLKTKKGFDDLYMVIDYARNNKREAASFILNYYEEIYGKPFDKTLEDLTAAKTMLPSVLRTADELAEKVLDGRERISSKQFEGCRGMVNAVVGHPAASAMLAMPGLAELSFFSEEEIELPDGSAARVMVKVRPDWIFRHGGKLWITDWKSVGQAATVRRMKYACKDYQYDFSAAMLRRVVSRFTDLEAVVKFVFVESDNPHPDKVRVREIAPFSHDKAEQKYMKTVAERALLDKKLKNNEWTGFDDAESLDETLEL